MVVIYWKNSYFFKFQFARDYSYSQLILSTRNFVLRTNGSFYTCRTNVGFVLSNRKSHFLLFIHILVCLNICASGLFAGIIRNYDYWNLHFLLKTTLASPTFMWTNYSFRIVKQLHYWWRHRPCFSSLCCHLPDFSYANGFFCWWQISEIFEFSNKEIRKWGKGHWYRREFSSKAEKCFALWVNAPIYLNCYFVPWE